MSVLATFTGVLSGLATGLITWWVKARSERQERRQNAIAERWHRVEVEAAKLCNDAFAELLAAIAKAVDNEEDPDVLNAGWQAWRTANVARIQAGLFLSDTVVEVLSEAHKEAWAALNRLRLRQDSSDPLRNRGEDYMEATKHVESLGAILRGELRNTLRQLLSEGVGLQLASTKQSALPASPE